MDGGRGPDYDVNELLAALESGKRRDMRRAYNQDIDPRMLLMPLGGMALGAGVAGVNQFMNRYAPEQESFITPQYNKIPSGVTELPANFNENRIPSSYDRKRRITDYGNFMNRLEAAIGNYLRSRQGE